MNKLFQIIVIGSVVVTAHACSGGMEKAVSGGAGGGSGASGGAGGSTSSSGSSGGSTKDSGGESVPVGAPCITSNDLSPNWPGFSSALIAIDTHNPGCGGLPCIRNHFQGLLTCPYGQTADGGPPPGADAGCVVPGTSTPVRPDLPDHDESVLPWCVSRPPGVTVICSCRCADAEGKTDDDAGPYCTCPTGFSCTPLDPEGPAAGSYCIPTGSAYDAGGGCGPVCDPTSHPCP
jgi:hypothetical protein